MAHQDPPDAGPSLELPSFGIDRTWRTRRARRDESAPEPEPDSERDPEPETRPDPNDPDPVAPAPPSGAAARLRSSPQASGELGFPVLPPAVAVLLVGLLVGLAAVLLAWGASRLRDAATGTACSRGPSLLMMLAVVVALTYLGGWLLRGLGVGDAGSTSFLAVGLVAVIAMLFLVDVLDDW